MKLKDWLNSWMGITRKERVGILALSVLILLAAILPGLVRIHNGFAGITDTSWIAVIRSLEKDTTFEKKSFQSYPERDHYTKKNNHYDGYPGKVREELFDFDPNTATAGDWKRLGLRDKTIATILNFTARGGRFREPEDLQRIYGLFPDEFERLEPYIRIEKKQYATGRPPATFITTENTISYKSSRVLSVDINLSDTSAWISLPGIGSKLASRIILFREKLGGFHSVEQVAETFGLQDSVFQKIRPMLKVENPELKTININTATIEEIKTHPYFRYALANAIVAYRNEHGPFEKVEDLKKVMAVTEDVYRKIVPYLSL